MPTGTQADFKLYHDQFHSGLSEQLQDNNAIFNGASNNTIRLISDIRPGEYEDSSFFKDLGDIVESRDPDSTAVATATKLEHGENSSVKVHRKITPIESTLSSWRTIAADPQEMSFRIGQQVGEKIMEDYATVSISVLSAAIGANAAMLNDVAATATPVALTGGLRKMGDKANMISAWVTNSNTYFNMVDNAIAEKIYEEAGLVVYGGTPGTLGKPVVVSDNEALGFFDTVDRDRILGLTSGAVTINESQVGDTAFELVTGLDNLVYRFQSEYAFNVGCKGYSYDKGTGGPNPTDAALATGANWVKTATFDKATAGVLINVNAA